MTLKAYRDGLTIRERLAKTDPSNADWQRDLLLTYNNVGFVLQVQGNLPEALKAYRDSLTIRERLANVDPGNTGWQGDLASSYNNVGVVLRAQGNLTDALKAYRDGLTIRERAWPKSIPAMPVGSANFRFPTTMSASYSRCRAIR